MIKNIKLDGTNPTMCDICPKGHKTHFACTILNVLPTINIMI